MERFFYQLGRQAGPHARRGRWWWRAATGTRRQRVQAEEEAGHDLIQSIRADTTRCEEPEVLRFVDEVGDHLRRAVADPDRTFRFEVLDEKEPNAFALPGGWVLISLGLLEGAEWDPAETAFVLGHEMGHIVHEHALERCVTEGALSAAMKVVPAARIGGGWLKQAGGKLLRTAYSRDRERDADEYGLKAMLAAGFPGAGAVRLLRRLEAWSGPAADLTYLSTHPAPAQRVAFVEKRLARRLP